MNSIEVNKITFSYRNHLVLCDLDWTVSKGAVYALIGLNGSGKTTLLRILAGLLKPKNGNVVISSCAVKHGYSTKKVSFMFEPSPLDVMLTAYQNLKLRCISLGEPIDQIDKLLRQVGVEKINKLVRNFSLGMKKRLELAYALIGYPEVLILDEPFDGLDIIGLDILRSIIKEYKAAGKTVLITEHNYSIIESIADCFGILYDGKIIANLVQPDILQYGGLENAIKEKITQYENVIKI